MADLVVALGDPLAREPSLTGGKGATLARLLGRGLPVPGGLVVTTETYRRLVDDPAVERRRAALDAALERDAGVEAAAAALREAIADRPLPETVTAALAELTGPYAVRSSATSEDRPEASFAGQHDSHLAVEGDDLATAVSGCLASLFTGRAVTYRARQALGGDVAMAVVVQRFVEPDTSGILFTADPVSGHRGVAVVDAGPGRGERQVSGRTTADTVRFDRNRGVVLDTTVGEGRSAGVLSAADVRALVAVGERIESELGGPQDVEWAIRDGEVTVLQARPITALFPVPEPRPADGATHVYYSFGHRQAMSDAMPPLVLETWRGLVDHLGDSFGFPEQFATRAGGRLYVDLTATLRNRRLRDRVVGNFEAVDEGGADELRALLAARPDEFPVTSDTPATYWRSVRALWRALPVGRKLLGTLPRVLLVDDPTGGPARLERTYRTQVEDAVERIHQHVTPRGRFVATREELLASPGWLVGNFYGPFLSTLLAGALLRRLFPDDLEVVAALALGAEGDVVVEMTMALGDLVDVARETPAVAAALHEGATAPELRAMPEAEAFCDALDEFLDEYGFRAVGEIDWSRARYHEDPTPLLHVLAGQLESGDPGGHRRHARRLDARANEAARALLRRSNPLLRPLVRRLVTVYRGYVGIREHPKFTMSRLLAQFRSAALDAGVDLHEAGAIPDPEAVWFLTPDELLAGLDEPRTLLGVDFEGRRRAFEQARTLTPPRILTSDGEVPRPPATEGLTDLRGTGAAPGVAEGVVRVVTDPSVERLRRGEVLVARYTDPGWTPLFLNAAAVVTEVGGRLTHGSLVAREYGLPAVVAVEGATTRLSTGDRVRVDGTHGTVELLDEATETAPSPRETPDHPTA